jgi:hypothetical protein
MATMAIVSGMGRGVPYLARTANAEIVPLEFRRKNSCHQIGSQGIGIYKWKSIFN